MKASRPRVVVASVDIGLGPFRLNHDSIKVGGGEGGLGRTPGVEADHI